MAVMGASPVQKPLLELEEQIHDPARPKCPCRWAGRRGFVGVGTILFTAALFLVVLPLATNPGSGLDGSYDAAMAMRSMLQTNPILWTGSQKTAQEALEDVVPTADSFLVVTAGPTTPTRRVEGQPFLSTGPDVALPTTAINVAAAVLEGALGRRLFPMRIETVDMVAHLGFMAGPVRPYAVWEVGSGLVLVDKNLVQTAWADNKVQHMIGSLASHLFTALADGVKASPDQTDPDSPAGVSSPPTLDRLGSMMGPAVALAVASAFAAAPPLWFCIVCPAVLGLLAPLVVNIALNQLAGYLCVHMQLPDDQCFDLLVGALGLGFVLALASAIPIFYVCKLPECAHRDGGGVVGLRGRVKGLLGRKWWGGGGGAGGAGGLTS